MKSIYLVALVGAFGFSHLTFSHHSDAGLDDFSIVVLEGKITEFSWKQPHVYFSVEIIENGEPVVWDIQMGSINGLARRGWSSSSLTLGEDVIVRANPAINGQPYAKLSSILRADGSAVAVDPGAPVASLVAASSMHGNWSGNHPSPAPTATSRPAPPIVDGEPCTTGFDCFFRANLVLTDAAKAAQEAFDPLSADNPEATCVGRPTPSALMSARGYLLQVDLSEQEEKIYIRSEWFNEERTIWMDGRNHPDPSETITTGHSIGHWEGDTLVVDTKNFDDHLSPYQVGVPSGSQKHVVERYRLSDDRTSMRVEYVLEDPEFLAEPLVHANTLYFSPHMQMFATDCDPDNTSRFLN